MIFCQQKQSADCLTTKQQIHPLRSHLLLTRKKHVDRRNKIKKDNYKEEKNNVFIFSDPLHLFLSFQSRIPESSSSISLLSMEIRLDFRTCRRCHQSRNRDKIPVFDFLSKVHVNLISESRSGQNFPEDRGSFPPENSFIHQAGRIPNPILLLPTFIAVNFTTSLIRCFS